MTLEELRADTRDVIPAADIESIINSDQQDIRMQAHENPLLLGFPVIVIGTRVKIPRIPFLRFMGAIE